MNEHPIFQIISSSLISCVKLWLQWCIQLDSFLHYKLDFYVKCKVGQFNMFVQMVSSFKNQSEELPVDCNAL